MKLVAMLVMLGLSSCGGTALEAPPAPGTSACDGQSGNTCVLCSDSKWHCGSAASAESEGGPSFEPCPSGSSTCTTGKSCITCNGDGTGLICSSMVGPTGATEPLLLKVKCSQ